MFNRFRIEVKHVAHKHMPISTKPGLHDMVKKANYDMIFKLI